MERSDIDRRQRVLSVRRTISDGVVVNLGKPTARGAQVPLSPRALEALDQLPARLDTPLLFPAPQGGLVRLDNFRRREWRPAIVAAGAAQPARGLTTCAPPTPRTSWRPAWACSNWVG